jgi:hypothetical protein
MKLYKCDKAEVVRPSWLALSELQRESWVASMQLLQQQDQQWVLL